MSDHARTPQHIEQRLWKEIGKARYGMLGLVGGAPVQHFQPMTAFAEPEDGLLWFFTRTDTDLARAVASGAEAMFVVQARDQDFQACLGGRLAPQLDRERMDRFWNPIVAAWYPQGKDDPALTLLRLDARDAAVWISEAGPVRFAWEIAKANLSHKQPDLGEHAHLDLGGAPSAG
jgi:general stress protein 26